MEPRVKKPLNMKIDLYTRCCLTLIAVLLTLVVIGLYDKAPALTAAAQAGPGVDYGQAKAVPILPDTAAQREEQLVQLRAINLKLDEINKTLLSGKVKVTVIGAENTTEGQQYVLPPKK